MKNFSIEIKWGIQYSLLLIIWMIGEKIAGLHDIHIGKQLAYTNLFAFVAVSIYLLALLDKKKNFYKGHMSWKQGFISGAVLSMVICILSPLVNYIIYTYVTPHFLSEMIRYRVAHHFQTQAQADTYFSMQSYIVLGIFDSLSKGILTAAVVAFFVKTKSVSK